VDKLAVCAIGGNSLVRGPGQASFHDQFEIVCETARALADIAASGRQLIVTHGNGPQVGFLLIRSHLSRQRLPEIPLDVCNALTQAEIGYMLQQALKNELRSRNIARGVVTLVTQVLVDRNDPAFANPSKPVGPFYTKREAMTLMKGLGWVMREDAGRGFRRYVPSPEPREIVECGEIERLAKAGTIVIAVGGGGIPVLEAEVSGSRSGVGRQPLAADHRQLTGLQGVAAVIDKDLASSLLANRVGADLLVVSTAVEQVFVNYRKPNQSPLCRTTLAEVEEYLRAGEFPAGSMGPKIDAAARFLKNGGERVIITDPAHLVAAMSGKAGTTITV
jgi:carbamate kinase